MPYTVKSSYTTDTYAQADGRRWVYETHVSSDKQVFTAQYLAPSKWDYEQTMLARAANIEAWLAGAEEREKEAEKQQIDDLIMLLETAPEHESLTTYKLYLEDEKSSLEDSRG